MAEHWIWSHYFKLPCLGPPFDELLI